MIVTIIIDIFIKCHIAVASEALGVGGVLLLVGRPEETRFS